MPSGNMLEAFDDATTTAELGFARGEPQNPVVPLTPDQTGAIRNQIAGLLTDKCAKFINQLVSSQTGKPYDSKNALLTDFNSIRDCPITEFDDEVPGLPMLSRINGLYLDVVFEVNEVDLLEQEVKRLLSEVTNPLARSGLEKLLAITGRAKELGLSVFFMCD